MPVPRFLYDVIVHMPKIAGQKFDHNYRMLPCRQTDMQHDFDQWLHHNNYERPHQGYRNMGKRPLDTIQSFCDPPQGMKVS